VTDQKLIGLYQQMYEMTSPECGCSCKLPYSCCSPEYCQGAIGHAQEHWGITLEPLGTPGRSTRNEELPLLGPEGCIAAPHLRPICTVHTCEINAFGFKVKDPDSAWTKRYSRLREEIDSLEFDRMMKKAREGEGAQPDP